MADLDPALLPGATDVAFYQEHGWWISPVVFSPGTLLEACAEQDAYYAGRRDLPLAVDGWRADRDGPGALRKNDFSTLTNPRLFDLLIAHPVIGATAALLTGAPGIRLWHDQLLYKPAASAAGRSDQTSVGWHTDQSYWKCCTGPMLTAWVPFTDCPAGLGPVSMLDGSHRWPATAGLYADGGDFFSNDLASLAAGFDRGGAPLREVPMAMRAGQVSWHDWRTLHGSNPNRLDRPRRSMAIHLQTAGNRWQAVVSKRTGRLVDHGIDRLVRALPDGTPDYADPLICPRLWPLPAERPHHLRAGG